jgi:hypothetical protein
MINLGQSQLRLRSCRSIFGWNVSGSGKLTQSATRSDPPAKVVPPRGTMRAMTTWFCDAYASWQKGGVENANGRLRRWLPRQIDIDKVSDEEIQDVVITANLTPRKCLGFKTPFQAILKELGKDVQIRFA